jgi:hypothetical protein
MTGNNSDGFTTVQDLYVELQSDRKGPAPEDWFEHGDYTVLVEDIFGSLAHVQEARWDHKQKLMILVEGAGASDFE